MRPLDLRCIMATGSVRPIEVLLVEDDENDVRIAREGLEDAKLLNRLTVIGDGSEVLAYLRGEGEHAGAPRPDLILLDLNLPGRDGRHVLADIKSDPDLHQIPVVVLTGSAAEEDVVRSYDHHANAYVTKPVDLQTFADVVRRIDEFFISVVRLPSI